MWNSLENLVAFPLPAEPPAELPVLQPAQPAPQSNAQPAGKADPASKYSQSAKFKLTFFESHTNPNKISKKFSTSTMQNELRDSQKHNWKKTTGKNNFPVKLGPVYNIQWVNTQFDKWGIFVRGAHESP